MDLNKAVTEVNAMMAGLLGDDIELKMILGPMPGIVKADPTQVEQILMNLAINARDAMPKGGTITFETANVKVDKTYSQQQLSMKPGEYVLLSVSDTGIGMTAKPSLTSLSHSLRRSLPGPGLDCPPCSESSGNRVAQSASTVSPATEQSSRFIFHAAQMLWENHSKHDRSRSMGETK